MENILAKLLESNSARIFEGTKELKEILKTPEGIPALCNVIVCSSAAQIRQSAAVILRKKVQKSRNWKSLHLEMRKTIKSGMLEALVNEKDKTVKNSIAQLIGTIGKHEVPENTWPEVLEFISTLCSSNTEINKEMGMYTLSEMTKISADPFAVHAESFAILFTKIWNDLNDYKSNLAYYTVMSMNALVPIVQRNQQLVNVYCHLIPKFLEVINAFAEDEKRGCDLFEILEELIEYDVLQIIAPHMQQVVDFCLEKGRNNSCPQQVRIKAISVVGWIIRSKPKMIQKKQLVEPIIDVLLNLMALPPENNEAPEQYFLIDSDDYTSISIASQTLDLVALNIPADKVVPYLLNKIEPAVQSDNIYIQRAAYLSLAVVSEGCSEFIRNKYLESFLKCVCDAFRNPAPIVRNAALFALGQFSEYLQPEISQYANELLPILFDFLTQTLLQIEMEEKDPPSLDRLFYALQTFCENLESALMPYLPTLMERLFRALNPNGRSLELKRAAITALSSAVTAVKKGFLPYFQESIQLLNVYINAQPDSELIELQSEALETLAAIAQYIGEENFRPFAHQTLCLSLTLLNDNEDPDVKRGVYSVLAALSIVMKGEFSPALPKVVEKMIDTIVSSEGILARSDCGDKDDIDIYSDVSDDEIGEQDIDTVSTLSGDSENYRYSVENAYTDEKEQACISLKEICSNVGAAYLPFMEKSFSEVFKMLNYPQDSIRVAAITTLQEFCLSLYRQQSKETLLQALRVFVPKCAELIRLDDERAVVTQCLDAYVALLDEMKGDVFVEDGHREAIMNCVVEVLTEKTACQDKDGENVPENEDVSEPEQEELLLESAGDVIPKFAAAISPDDFLCYFPNVFKLLAKRMAKQSSVTQRAFAYGVIAECMKSLDIYVEKYVNDLLKMWLIGTKDRSSEVRNNAVFGLGEMILHGKYKVFSHYNTILQELSPMVAKEKHPGVLDNICSAIAKMIIVDSSAIPLDQVFPVLLQKLPIRNDFDENVYIIECFVKLYEQGNQVLKHYIENVIQISLHIYCNDQIHLNEKKQLLINLITSLNRDFSQEFSQCVNSLGPNVAQSIQNLLST